MDGIAERGGTMPETRNSADYTDKNVVWLTIVAVF